jgi:hypothetical protein
MPTEPQETSGSAPGDTSTPVLGDGVLTIQIDSPGQGGSKMAESSLTEMFRDRLLADRDRHSSNATSFEKVLEMQYAQSMQFRDANAARIVMEAGSGRTRAESNGPDNTAAQKG